MVSRVTQQSPVRWNQPLGVAPSFPLSPKLSFAVLDWAETGKNSVSFLGLEHTENTITGNMLTNPNLVVLGMVTANFCLRDISHSNIICEQLISNEQGPLGTPRNPHSIGLASKVMCAGSGMLSAVPCAQLQNSKYNESCKSKLRHVFWITK